MEVRNRFKGLVSDRQSAWWNKDRGSWHCTGDREQDHHQEKEMQKSKMAVWGGLTNSCEKKRSKKQRRKAKIQFSSVQLLSRVQLLLSQLTASCQASLSIANSRSLLKLMSIELVMPSNHLILCGPLLLLPSIFPSIRVFSNESVLHISWPKYWNFGFSISINLSNKYSGLISFRMDWLDLLAVQETLKSLLQHHSSKASILWCSAFFMVQHSHPYMTTGKPIA